MDDILSKYVGAKPTTIKVESGRPYTVVLGDINNGLSLNLQLGVTSLVIVDEQVSPHFNWVIILRGLVRGKEYLDLIDYEERAGHFRTPKKIFKLGVAAYPTPTDGIRLLNDSTFFTDLEKELTLKGGTLSASDLKTALLAPFEQGYTHESLETNTFKFNF